jgi:phage head maturation protease
MGDEIKRGTPRFTRLVAATEPAGEGEGGAIRQRFLLSTDKQVRDGDVIKLSAWRLDNYRKNPVVLFNHGAWGADGLPVGKCPEIGVSDALRGVVEFAGRDVHPFGHMIGRMVRAGFLNAASVRWDPLKWVFNEEIRGYEFEEVDLLEWSVVSVPADADALAERARAAGIDVTPLRAHLERLLDGELATRDLVAIPRSVFEREWKRTGEARLFVDAGALVRNEQPAPAAEPTAPASDAASPEAPSAATDAAPTQEPGEAGATTDAAQPTTTATQDTQPAATPESPEAGTEQAADDDDEEDGVLFELEDDDTEADDEIEVDAAEIKAAVAQAVAELRTAVTGKV